MNRVILFFIFVIFSNCKNTYDNVYIFDNYNQGLEFASHKNKKILLAFDFWGNPVGSVDRLIHDKDLASEFSDIVVVHLRVDDPYSGHKNRVFQKKKFGTSNQPYLYLLNSKGILISDSIGYCRRKEFIFWLNKNRNGKERGLPVNWIDDGPHRSSSTTQAR